MTVWHSTRTVEQEHQIERVQKTCLKVILGSDYTGYEEALILTNLETLKQRREERCLRFSLKSLLHPVHSNMFPVNPHVTNGGHKYDHREHFKVNWARTESYRMSAVPYLQRMLNGYVNDQKKPKLA